MQLGPGKVYVKLSRLDLDTLDRIGVMIAECRGQVARRLIERAIQQQLRVDTGLCRWRQARQLELNRRTLND